MSRTKPKPRTEKGRKGSSSLGVSGSIAGVAVLLAVIWAVRSQGASALLSKEHVHAALLQTESATSNAPRVAVGFGGCLDAIVRATRILTDAGVTPPAAGAHLQDFDTLGSPEELATAFAYFFSKGAAAERYVSDEKLWKALVAAAQGSSSTRWLLGGNAPLMGNRIAREGGTVLLASRISKRIANEIHERVRLVSHDTEEPGSAEDADVDVHVLLEFEHGAVWGPWVAPRANRLALHRDQHNPKIDATALTQSMPEFKPDALVLAGFQFLDGFPTNRDVKLQRLQRLSKVLQDYPNLPTHFEMASLVDFRFIKDVVDLIFPHVTSLGMNEQELALLHDTIKHDTLTRSAAHSPRVRDTLDTTKALLAMLRSGPAPQLTRIHVHTLAYQLGAVMYDSSWKDTGKAMVKASLIAARYVCGSENVNMDAVKVLLDSSFSRSDGERIGFGRDDSFRCWREDIAGTRFQFCLAPNLVCSKPRYTVGAGDNISSGGFFVQVPNSNS